MTSKTREKQNRDGIKRIYSKNKDKNDQNKTFTVGFIILDLHYEDCISVLCNQLVWIVLCQYLL